MILFQDVVAHASGKEIRSLLHECERDPFARAPWPVW
jgi:hypothetical protein